MSDNNSGWPAKPANPANGDDELASLAPLAGGGQAAGRDAHGRFITGNSGGGRKKGSRNRLTETFLAAIESDFAEHGPTALATLRADDPAAYLRIVASLVPRDLILKREQEPDLSELTYDEVMELADRKQRNVSIRYLLDRAGR